jgi:hypothetical protein
MSITVRFIKADNTKIFSLTVKEVRFAQSHFIYSLVTTSTKKAIYVSPMRQQENQFILLDGEISYRQHAGFLSV